MFSSATGILSEQDQLLQLRQGDSSSDYTLQFRMLAATSGWNEASLMCAYRQGLNSSICMQMAIYDDNVGLESFMQCASRISQCLADCHLDEAAHQVASPAYSSSVPEPMQVDSTRLSRMEHARRWNMSVLCSIRPLHQDLPRLSIMPSGEYFST